MQSRPMSPASSTDDPIESGSPESKASTEFSVADEKSEASANQPLVDFAASYDLIQKGLLDFVLYFVEQGDKGKAARRDADAILAKIKRDEYNHFCGTFNGIEVHAPKTEYDQVDSFFQKTAVLKLIKKHVKPEYQEKDKSNEFANLVNFIYQLIAFNSTQLAKYRSLEKEAESVLLATKSEIETRINKLILIKHKTSRPDLISKAVALIREKCVESIWTCHCFKIQEEQQRLMKAEQEQARARIVELEGRKKQVLGAKDREISELKIALANMRNQQRPAKEKLAVAAISDDKEEKVAPQTDKVTEALQALKLFIETHEFDVGLFGGEKVENNKVKVPMGMKIIHDKIADYLKEEKIHTVKESIDLLGQIKQAAESRKNSSIGFLFLNRRRASTKIINAQLAKLNVENLPDANAMEGYLTTGLEKKR